MDMRWDVVGWAAVTLLLFAAEALAPGAFMLWMGIAAGVVFLTVLLVPGVPLLAQVAAFVVLSFVSIQVYRKFVRGRGRERESDRPTLNRRAWQHVGRVVPLDQAIVAVLEPAGASLPPAPHHSGDAVQYARVLVSDTDGVILHVQPAPLDPPAA